MPSLNFGDAPPWLQWLLAMGVVVAFVGGALRLIPASWRTISTFVNTINRLATLPEQQAKEEEFRREVLQWRDAQDEKIDEIHHEVNFNDGSSAKDGIVRTENAVGRLEIGMKALYERVGTAETAAADAAREAAAAAVAAAKAAADAKEALEATNKKEI